MIFLKSDNLIWTQHSLAKLRQYRLSSSRVMRVLRHPKRREVGVAENTVACMQTAGSTKHPHEIWVMFQQKSLMANGKSQIAWKNKEITIISVWRYPGVSPIHEPPPIPEEVWELLKKMK